MNEYKPFGNKHQTKALFREVTLLIMEFNYAFNKLFFL